ncbi:MAG: hypothetical protein GXP42_09805, partial [Chloroflexi bacterium]|nr:hypothetical protein [Chloroflexota bacterium]
MTRSSKSGDASSATQALETLRSVLLAQDRATIEDLRRELNALKGKVDDAERLIEMIEPLLVEALAKQTSAQPDAFAEAIRPALALGLRRQIQEDRESIVAVLAPIIGRTIQRAIAEALENLARQVDARMQRLFSISGQWRLLKARLRGIDDPLLVLRDSLPWRTEHVFLIHNETGMVLAQDGDGAAMQDADLIAAMLTAIRSFARESFRGPAADALHEIRYGDKLILLEEGARAYLALVGEGVPPPTIRAQMRDVLADIHVQDEAHLAKFRGDPGSEKRFGHYLTPLLGEIAPSSSRPPTMGLAFLATLFFLFLFFCGWATYRLSPRVMAYLAPTAVVYVVLPSATPTPTSAPTSTPT